MLFPESDYIDFRFSPDFTRLAVTRLDPGSENIDIWITDLARQNTSRLTAAPTVEASPVWSPDGTKVVFRTNRVGRLEFFLKSSSGAGAESRVLSIDTQRQAGLTAMNIVPGDWSPDGRHIVYASTFADSKIGLAVFPIADSGPLRSFGKPAAEFTSGHPSFSPDGKYVVYDSNETGRFEVYVEPFQPSDRRWKISTNGGYEPRWRADGRELYYLSEDRKLMAVPVGAGPSFGVPAALFQTRVPESVDLFRTNYMPDRDGRRFLVNTLSTPNSPPAITLVQNWTAALQK